MNQRELARRGGISQAQVSRVVAAGRMPGPEFCVAAAKALNLPPDEVFRAAGLLPESNMEEKLGLRILHLYEQMQDPKHREITLEFMEVLLKLEERKNENASTVSLPSPPAP